MKIVYIICSERITNRFYVGLCTNLKNRLTEHNTGECKITATHRPWGLESAILFCDDSKAQAFERYLKTGSGRAFSKKHF